MARTWMMLSYATRQYRGNTGYEDDPQRVYRYDSFVGNHKQVAAGDVAVLTEKKRVLGLARIESIYEQEGFKKMLNCPKCGASGIKWRENLEPHYRCRNKHEFDEPVEIEKPCQEFEAHFGGTFLPLSDDVLSVQTLRQAAYRPNLQLAIQEVDLSRLGDLPIPEPSAEPKASAKAEKYLKLKDSGDIAVIRQTGTYAAARLHNDITNRILELFRKRGKTVLEGQSPEAMFDCLVKDYAENGRDLLIEVKSRSERSAVRMAVGQLLDYRRFVSEPARTDVAVLLPNAPEKEISEFLTELGIGLLFFEGQTLRGVPPIN